MYSGVRILLYIVIFSFVVIGFYMLMQSITLINSARRNMGKIYSQLHSKNEKRVKQIEADRRRYGTTSATSGKESKFSRILQHVDDVLIYSGMSIKYHWLNTATYIVLMIVLSAGAFFLFLIVTTRILVGGIAALLVIVIPYAYMVHLSDVNYKNTENQMQFFVNMVSNNSMITNDITTVLEDTAQYVNEPIRSAIYRAISTTTITGNKDDCIRQLTREIEHPLFVRFIRNLDMSSKNEADYRKVSSDYSEQVDEQIKALTRLRALFSNARGEILLMLGMGIGLLAMVCSLTEKTMVQAFAEMSSSIVGVLCLILWGSVQLFTLLYVLVGMRR